MPSFDGIIHIEEYHGIMLNYHKPETGEAMRDRKTMNLLMRWFVFVVLMLPVLSSYAAEANPGVYMQQVDKPVSAVYDKLYKSLEDARFFVVFEPNIGKNLARFSDKWGDDYNRNNIS